MKYIILMLSVITNTVYADIKTCEKSISTLEIREQQEIKTDVPKHLEGAVIIVKLKDGRESIVSAENFKVVPRVQQFIVTRTQQEINNNCVIDSSEKNRLSLLAGEGPKNKLNVNVSNYPNEVDVSSRYGIVGGLQYQRKVTDKVSLGLQGQTNNGALVLIGVDF